MDDFPASAVGPKPPRPPLTVVIPVKNGGNDFERCLERLCGSTFRDFELIVVDDASTDSSIAVAERFGAKVIRHGKTTGPAAARNNGALLASAPIVFFLDADVALDPDAITRAMSRFRHNRDLAALFGSYDNAPSAKGSVSCFRNLLHHFVHQQGIFENDARVVHTFWTGIGAIRREVFLERGGFDPRRYRRPAIEDIELGYRITRAGGTIQLCRDIQGTHLKHWSLLGMIKTDILCRGVPWLLLMKRSSIAETDLNVKSTQKWCVVLAGLAAILGCSSLLWPISGVGAIACLTAIVLLNFDFYRLLRARKGLAFAGTSIALHVIYYYCCALSVILAEMAWHLGGLKYRSENLLETLDGRLRADLAGETPPARIRSTRSGVRESDPLRHE